jgi:hypothetical protein
MTLLCLFERMKRPIGKTYPFHYYCHVDHDSHCSNLSYSSLWSDWHSAWSYLTKSGSIEYHRCAAKDENEVDDGSAETNGDRRDDSSRRDAEVVVEVAVENVRWAVVEDDGDDAMAEDGRDDEAKRMKLIEMMMIEATKIKCNRYWGCRCEWMLTDLLG